MRRRALHRTIPVAALVALAACAGDDHTAPRDVVVATTTSVEDTGLMEAFGRALRDDLPRIRVRFVAVGSGHALALARRGDADLVIVHDPAAEDRFVAEGHGDRRRTIMRNDFVVVGPPADPADVRGAATTPDAFLRIAQARALFLSRGDSSGTHRKEVALWRSAGVEPEGEWYLEAGVGQGDLLRMASERRAYALVDRGTYRYHEGMLELDVVHADQPPLDNPYSVIVATRAPNAEAAGEVAAWLTGPKARAVIETHGAARFGAPLFDVVE